MIESGFPFYSLAAEMGTLSFIATRAGLGLAEQFVGAKKNAVTGSTVLNAPPMTGKDSVMRGTLWLLVYGLFFYLMMRYGCGAHMVHGGHGRAEEGGETTHGDHGAPSAGRAAGVSVRDPVCGMEVTPDSAYSRVFQGREYRFCSRKCLDQFDTRPEQYVAQKGGLL